MFEVEETMADMKPRSVGGRWAWWVCVAILAGAQWGGATEYFVGKEGHDDAPGTRMQPFASIGRAAQVMAPGDVCVVSRGLYRETVRPARSGTFESPIRFVAVTGDVVTVSGADPVTGWQIDSGAVYRTSCAFVMQVFIDDQPAPLTDGIPATVLESQGAWWQDTNGMLYVRMPQNDSPALHRVEAQLRPWGFDFTRDAHIEVKGLNVFAGSISLRGADHCRVEDCHIWWAGAGERNTATGEPGTVSSVPKADLEGWQVRAGIVVGGNDNEVLLTSIVGSAGHGVEFEPTAVNNRLVNCLIRGTGSRVIGAVGVLASGTAQVIRQMTILDCQGGGIVCSNLMNGRIEYCEVHHTGKGGGSTGAVSLSGNGKGTVLAFNWIRDNQAEQGDGVLFDAGAENYVVYRNVIWKQPGCGVRLAGGASYSFICNNTVSFCGAAMDTASGGGKAFKGMRVVNNILSGHNWVALNGRAPAGITWQKNWEGEAPGFVDATNRNFHLAVGSPCIDAAQEEPEFTEGFIGEQPDQGAYETGGEDWTPGCRATESANQAVKPAIRLVLDSTTPGTEIRYTLDGRVPTVESLLYTGAVSFVSGASLRARAFSRGMEPSPISTVWVQQGD